MLRINRHNKRSQNLAIAICVSGVVAALLALLLVVFG